MSVSEFPVNSVCLSGVLLELSAPRYTPYGLFIVEGVLRHSSRQLEGGIQLRVGLDVCFVAIGNDFIRINASSIGKSVIFNGFWGVHGIKKYPVLHVSSFCFFCD